MEIALHEALSRKQIRQNEIDEIIIPNLPKDLVEEVCTLMIEANGDPPWVEQYTESAQKLKWPLDMAIIADVFKNPILEIANGVIGAPQHIVFSNIVKALAIAGIKAVTEFENRNSTRRNGDE